MSLPQLIGLKCVTCQKSIGSVLEGTFCAACGNPVHQKCAGAAQQAPAERCPQCGGEPESSLAKEVRRERGAAAQDLARVQAVAKTGSAAAYPIASACPNCGSASHTRQRPEGWVAFTWDRVCSECGTRYSPPTPLWAAFVFLALGLGFVAFGVVGLMAGDICVGFLTLLGILAIIHGIRSLARPGKT